MLRFVFWAGSLCCACSTFAQAPDIEAWMARHFSGKQSVKQDNKADEALYAAVGLDSLRKNRFIGEVSGTVKLPNGSAPVKFIMWCDTLEAILHYHSPGDTTTYVADLRNNTIAFHTTSTEEGGINSSINDLRERVVVNWYRYKEDAMPWRVNRVKPFNKQGGILAEQDMQRWTVANGGTIRFIRYTRGPSPFLDALEWLPYGGDYPFNLFMQLARAGDPIPRMLKSSAGSIEVNLVSTSPRQRPTYRIGHTVLDTRTIAHRALPIRKSDRRAGVVELDPVVEIPAGSGHGSGTGDPGGAYEPEVTYTGRRSQMRVHRKEPCGEVGTVVVKVWIDRQGKVQRAEVDKNKSSLRSEVCLNNALEATKQDTYYPIEGGMPLDAGEVIIAYKTTRGAYGQVDGNPNGYSGSGNGTGAGNGSGIGSSRTPFNYELTGRTLISKPDITKLPKGQGKVVMDIYVDRKGKVMSTGQNMRGSTTLAPDLVDAARNATMDLRFSADQEAPEQQRGRVVFVFRLE